MNIRTKLAVGFGIVLLLITVLGVTVLFNMADVKQQFAFVIEHDAPVMANARHLSKLVVDMETDRSIHSPHARAGPAKGAWFPLCAVTHWVTISSFIHHQVESQRFGFIWARALALLGGICSTGFAKHFYIFVGNISL